MGNKNQNDFDQISVFWISSRWDMKALTLEGMKNHVSDPQPRTTFKI